MLNNTNNRWDMDYILPVYFPARPPAAQLREVATVASG